MVVAYENCVQCWRYQPATDGGVFVFNGSTNNINGKILTGTLLNGKVIVQIQRRDRFEFEVHLLNSQIDNSTNNNIDDDDESNTSEKIIIPPSGGQGPFKIQCPDNSDYFAIIGKNGEVTLFNNQELTPIELTLETTLGSDQSPLIDIKGRWVAISPKNNINAYTELKMPPTGPLYERIVEGFSSTAAAGLKQLSDASVAGIKNYLNKEHNKKKNTGIPLNQMINNLWDKNTSAVQIVDIPTKSTICHFTPLYGVSHLSLSPHDTTLATVSLNGDHVYTYDLSFVPNEVSLTGRYVRGKSPAKVRKIIWDSYGGLGIVTWDKGSLHWFDKRRSFDSTNKVWTLSGWQIENGILASGGFKQLMLLQRGQIFISDINDGKVSWKYDLPHGAINERDAVIAKTIEPEAVETDPLSNFEIESCLPYPYIHEDRRIVMAVYEKEEANQQYRFEGKGKKKYPILELFGRNMTTNVIDFGKPDGRAKFSPQMQGEGVSGGEDCNNNNKNHDDDDDEIRQAMESMVIPSPASDESSTTLKATRGVAEDVDDIEEININSDRKSDEDKVGDKNKSKNKNNENDDDYDDNNVDDDADDDDDYKMYNYDFENIDD